MQDNVAWSAFRESYNPQDPLQPGSHSGLNSFSVPCNFVCKWVPPSWTRNVHHLLMKRGIPNVFSDNDGVASRVRTAPRHQQHRACYHIPWRCDATLGNSSRTSSNGEGVPTRLCLRRRPSSPYPGPPAPDQAEEATSVPGQRPGHLDIPPASPSYHSNRIRPSAVPHVLCCPRGRKHIVPGKALTYACGLPGRGCLIMYAGAHCEGRRPVCQEP